MNDTIGWRRHLAQRLLVDGRHTSAIPALKALCLQPGIGATHALWTLHGLGKLDADTHRSALLSPDPVLRRNAVRALSPEPGMVDVPDDSHDGVLRLGVGIENDGLPDGGNPRPETLRDPLADDRDTIPLSPVEFIEGSLQPSKETQLPRLAVAG